MSLYNEYMSLQFLSLVIIFWVVCIFYVTEKFYILFIKSCLICYGRSHEQESMIEIKNRDYLKLQMVNFILSELVLLIRFIENKEKNIIHLHMNNHSQLLIIHRRGRLSL